MAPRLDLLDARPTLEVADLAATLAFLRDVIGLDADVAEGDPPTFAILRDGVIGLVQVDRPAVPEGAACYLTITGLDELAQRIAAAGVELDVPVTTRPWGLRDLVVTLPGGGPKIAFGEAV